jgi:hypothetical protein
MEGSPSSLYSGAILTLVYGVLSLEDAVHLWTASPIYDCRGRTGLPASCVAIDHQLVGFVPSPWTSVVLGVASLVAGASLLVFARTVKRRRAALPAPG